MVDSFVIHSAKQLPAGLHLYDCISGIVNFDFDSYFDLLEDVTVVSPAESMIYQNLYTIFIGK